MNPPTNTGPAPSSTAQDGAAPTKPRSHRVVLVSVVALAVLSAAALSFVVATANFSNGQRAVTAPPFPALPLPGESQAASPPPAFLPVIVQNEAAKIVGPDITALLPPVPSEAKSTPPSTVSAATAPTGDGTAGAAAARTGPQTVAYSPAIGGYTAPVPRSANDSQSSPLPAPAAVAPPSLDPVHTSASPAAPAPAPSSAGVVTLSPNEPTIVALTQRVDQRFDRMSNRVDKMGEILGQVVASVTTMQDSVLKMSSVLGELQRTIPAGQIPGGFAYRPRSDAYANADELMKRYQNAVGPSAADVPAKDPSSRILTTHEKENAP